MGNYYLVMLYKSQKFSEERKLNRLRFVGKNNFTYSMSKATKYSLDKARKLRDDPNDFAKMYFKFVIVNENLKMVR